jgi:Ca-activated chloride channel family protein
MVAPRRQNEDESKDSMRNYITIFIVALSIFVTAAHAQNQADALIRQGNKLYEQQKFDAATTNYQKAIIKDPNYTPGLFNLGNSLYQQQKFDASRQVMTATANATKDQTAKAGVNYNIGNTYMAEKKWEDAVNSYKQTLRNNPNDLDAKYNLSYAEQMMKKQQGGGGGKDNKKDDKKDQKKDKKDQQNKNDKGKDKDKDKQNQDQQDQNKGDKDKQDEHPQGQPSKLSQQQADQVLNALQNEEKKLHDKLNKEKGIPSRMAKDW